MGIGIPNTLHHPLPRAASVDVRKSSFLVGSWNALGGHETPSHATLIGLVNTSIIPASPPVSSDQGRRQGRKGVWQRPGQYTCVCSYTASAAVSTKSPSHQVPSANWPWQLVELHAPRAATHLQTAPPPPKQEAKKIPTSYLAPSPKHSPAHWLAVVGKESHATAAHGTHQ